ncbi:MAG TPA: hypothetical protein VIF09_03775 [Polyangiaceae bacterium]|jgi:hypothetical protein
MKRSFLLGLGLLALARTASADPQPDVTETQDESARHRIDRTWLYADDARVAAPLTVVGMTSASYTQVGSSPSRIDSPFPSTYKSFAANTAQPGGMMTVGGEVGLFPHVSVMALGQMGFGGEASGVSGGAVAGLRVSLLPASWEHLHLVTSVGYLREAWQGPIYNEDKDTWLPPSTGGANGGWVQASISGDVDRLRMAATFHGEHVFSDGRDPLDVMVQLGASYRVAGHFRAGLEYVGQDLEEVAKSSAEGGARHFAGPIMSLQLLGDRMSIVAGPAFGLSDLSPRLLGRMAVAYGF